MLLPREPGSTRQFCLANPGQPANLAPATPAQPEKPAIAADLSLVFPLSYESG